MRRILGHGQPAAVSAERQPLGLSDIVPAAVLFVFAWLADSVNRAALPELSDGLPVSDLVVLGATVLPIALRRRFPLSVLTVVTAAFLVCRFEDVPEFTATSLALFIALFAAGAYSRHRMRDVVRGAAIAVSMGTVVWGVFTSQGELPGNVVLFNVFSVLINSAFFVVGWLMGDLWRKRSEDQAELARRAEILERQASQLAEQAVASERLRIAQELHDVVAHHVSLMGVQAAAARRSLPPGADTAASLLESIEEGGRQAVTEMDGFRVPPVFRERVHPSPAHSWVESTIWWSRCVPPGSMWICTASAGHGARHRSRPGRLPRHPGGAHQRPETRIPSRGGRRSPTWSTSWRSGSGTR